MKWLVVLCLTACGSSESAAPKPGSDKAAGSGDAYKADIDNLCDVMSRSGAIDHDYNDRTYLIATWLSGHLTTQEARTFLAKIQPIEGEPKAKALEDEARRVGLRGCALADEWRKPLSR